MAVFVGRRLSRGLENQEPRNSKGRCTSGVQITRCGAYTNHQNASYERKTQRKITRKEKIS
jgi:hypothetical protein